MAEDPVEAAKALKSLKSKLSASAGTEGSRTGYLIKEFIKTFKLVVLYSSAIPVT